MKKIDLTSLDIEKYINSIDIDKIEKALRKLKPPSKFRNIIDNLEDIIKANIADIENIYKDYSKHLSKKEMQQV